jgi:GNAT superfamily N-acetyltransferase
VRIENVADHPTLVALIGRWHWDEWGHADPAGSLETWTASLRRRTGRDSVPATYVALDGVTPVGSVCLVVHDMPDRADLASLTPWVAGTFVLPDRRGLGVGRLLVEHAATAARRMGVPRLYLYASDAAPFYERLGWERLMDGGVYEGERVTIMTLDLGSPD